MADVEIAYPERVEDMAVFRADVERTPVDAFASNASPAFSGSATVVVEQVSAMFAGNQDPAATAEAIAAGVAEVAEQVGK